MICPFCKSDPHDPRCIDYMPPRIAPAVLPQQPVDTRKAAFEQADRRTAQQRVLDLVAAAGQEGVTCDEAEAAMSGLHQSVSPAFHALSRKGSIRDSGKRRLTRSGRAAIVWVTA